MAARRGQMLGGFLTIEHQTAAGGVAQLVFHAVQRLQPLGNFVGEVVDHARPSLPPDNRPRAGKFRAPRHPGQRAAASPGLAGAAAKGFVSRPISRVLSGGSPLRDGHSSGTPLARRLEQPTRAAAGIEPGTLRAQAASVPRRPYSVLLPVGFAVPPPSPEARCALTAPFHPCPCGLPRAGGLISVALSLGSPPAAVSRHRQSLEPGLSSTARLGRQNAGSRGSGRPAG